MDTEKELVEYLRGKEVYIFGAGKYAERLFSRFKKNNISVHGFLVTERQGNPLEVERIRVWSIAEMRDSGKDITALTVVIGVSREQKKIVDFLLDCGYHKVLMVKPPVWHEMALREMMEEYNNSQQDFYLDMDYPGIERWQTAVAETGTGRALFRTPLSGGENWVKILREKCDRGIFESMYGSYQKLPCAQGEELSGEVAKREGFEIYAVTSHMDKQKEIALKTQGVIPLQIGAALTSIRKGYITDDTGDNISVENRDYCECTGLYWIWKNTSGQKYVGLSQYRRRFRLDETSVRYMIDQDVDAVAILPEFTSVPLAEFFYQYIYKYDWKLLKAAVIKYDSAYGELFEQYEQSHFFVPCNMAVFKRAWFDRYCEFAFAAASEIDCRYKEMELYRKDRYMGYLFENLLSLFLMRYHGEMNIAYADMEFIR